MGQRDGDGAIKDTIEAAYEAATGDLSWSEFGTRLERALGAESITLWTGSAAGVGEVFHSPPHAAGEAHRYSLYYHSRDLWAAGARRATAHLTPRDAPMAFLGSELVPDRVLQRSEYYVDMARPLGMHHLLGTVMPMGEAGNLVIGGHSPHDHPGFGEAHRARLLAVLPHLRRALQLRHRLAPRHAAAGFEAMPTPAIVVTADLRILTANAAAEAALLRGGARALRGGHATRLAAEHAGDDAALIRRVREVALLGSDGGTVPLTRDGRGPVLALVLPLPGQVTGHDPGLNGGRALVLLKDPLAPSPLALRLLRDLHDLSAGEAEVALAAAAGETAARIAQARGVSASTVRSQIRAALRKAGVDSLRQLTLLVGQLG